MLLPHLRIPMGHQTFESQEKALEAAMKLEFVPKYDTREGVQQIHKQLGAMHLEIQSLWTKWGKGVGIYLWCEDCRVAGLHDTT